jgi:hypothetical protein
LERKLDLEAPWLDRPKPKAELAEPNTGKGTPEELKAMVDLIVLAIQTDSSRIFTLTSDFKQRLRLRVAAITASRITGSDRQK